MNNIKVKIVNKSKNPLPKYETQGAAGMDLRANIEEAIVLKPLERKLIPCGIYVELPQGYEAQVRARSGLSLNHGITLINGTGTVDCDYRGEWRVPLVNLSDTEYVLNPGERIAQVVISKYERIEWEEVEELSTTDRGVEGFGSTGKA